jgi:hypothetical protein
MVGKTGQASPNPSEGGAFGEVEEMNKQLFSVTINKYLC